MLPKVDDRIAMLYVIRPCVLAKGYDAMAHRIYFDRVFSVCKGDDGIPRPTSFHRVCCLCAKMEHHLQLCPIMCAA